MPDTYPFYGQQTHCSSPQSKVGQRHVIRISHQTRGVVCSIVRVGSVGLLGRDVSGCAGLGRAGRGGSDRVAAAPVGSGVPAAAAASRRSVSTPRGQRTHPRTHPAVTERPAAGGTTARSRRPVAGDGSAYHTGAGATGSGASPRERVVTGTASQTSGHRRRPASPTGQQRGRRIAYGF